MFCNLRLNFAMAVVFPAHGPPVITIRCTLGGPSLSDDAFQVVRFWSVSSSHRVSAASVAQGAACLNRSAARHIVIGRGGGVQLHGYSPHWFECQEWHSCCRAVRSERRACQSQPALRTGA